MTQCPLCETEMQLHERRWGLTGTWRVYRCETCDRDWSTRDDDAERVEAAACISTGGVDPRANTGEDR